MKAGDLMVAANISAELASLWIKPLCEAMEEYRIISIKDKAMFIAQTGHESLGFNKLVESLNYSSEALMVGFKKYFTQGTASKYGRTDEHPADQRSIANIIYGNRMGNIEPEDGWKYRGRGLIQITGRDNYRECSKALTLDLVLAPQLLQQVEYAARSAAWFFTSKGCLKHSGNVVKVTRIINGGNKGLKDRQARYDKALTVLSDG